MNIRLNESVLIAITALHNAGFSGYLVGGALRDFLMGKMPHDLDITTDANKEQILETFKNFKTVDVGTKFGTILVYIIGIELEITPHRAESDYLDHRHPSKVEFIKDLKEDLSRRDFTINAIAFSLDDDFIDYFDGMKDIERKIIRSVGDPNKRFEEDALRILRAIRFSFTLGFSIEENTKNAVFANKDLLSFISMERKMAELKKILNTNIYPAINEYKDVLNTFIKMNDVNKTVDKYQDWRLKLAYILDNSFIDNLSSLKLSNDDTKLIKTLMLFKNINLQDDYTFAKTFSETNFRKELIDFKTIFDDYSYKNKITLLRKRIVDELLISGYDLINLGYKGSAIKDIQNELKDQIYNGNLINSKAVLLDYLNQKNKEKISI